jgi:hypothetical protein
MMQEQGWSVVAQPAGRGDRILIQFGDELAEEIIGDRLRPEGWDGKMEVPCTREVCPLCDGRGRVVNPSIDAGGITESDWSRWDQDERESYWSGAYDMTCPRCLGRNVVDVPGFEPEIQKTIDAWARSEADYAELVAFERRHGC